MTKANLLAATMFISLFSFLSLPLSLHFICIAYGFRCCSLLNAVYLCICRGPSPARALSLLFFLSFEPFSLCAHQCIRCVRPFVGCMCAFWLCCCCCYCCCCCRYCRFPSFYTVTIAAIDWLQFILTHRNTYRAHTPHILCSHICTHGSATIASTHTYSIHVYLFPLTH